MVVAVVTINEGRNRRKAKVNKDFFSIIPPRWRIRAESEQRRGITRLRHTLTKSEWDEWDEWGYNGTNLSLVLSMCLNRSSANRCHLSANSALMLSSVSSLESLSFRMEASSDLASLLGVGPISVKSLSGYSRFPSLLLAMGGGGGAKGKCQSQCVR
jgi:hypothetical protein